MKGWKSIDIHIIPQCINCHSGHKTALLSYTSLKLDKSFFMNFLNASNRQFQNSKKCWFYLLCCFVLFTAWKLLDNFTDFSRVGFGEFFEAGYFGFIWSQSYCLFIIKRKYTKSYRENEWKTMMMQYIDDIQICSIQGAMSEFQWRQAHN